MNSRASRAKPASVHLLHEHFHNCYCLRVNVVCCVTWALASALTLRRKIERARLGNLIWLAPSFSGNADELGCGCIWKAGRRFSEARVPSARHSDQQDSGRVGWAVPREEMAKQELSATLRPPPRKDVSWRSTSARAFQGSLCVRACMLSRCGRVGLSAAPWPVVSTFSSRAKEAYLPTEQQTVKVKGRIFSGGLWRKDSARTLKTMPPMYIYILWNITQP